VVVDPVDSVLADLVQAGVVAEDLAARRTVVLPTAAPATNADQRDQTVRATAVPAAREDHRTVGTVHHRTVTVRREALPIVVRVDPVDSVPVVADPVGAVDRDLGLAVPVDSAAEAVVRLGKSFHRRSLMN
jgi:hypothetical protein